MRNKGQTVSSFNAWLTRQKSLPNLQLQFPASWRKVEAKLEMAIRNNDQSQLDGMIRPVLPDLRHSLGRQRILYAQLLKNQLIEQRLAVLCLEQYLLRSFSIEGVSKSVPWRDRLIYRCLFFTGNDRRKLVSPVLFKLLWPLVEKPTLLLPLAEARGIFGFYDRQLVNFLANLIGRRKCLEVGAGDGFLAAALSALGVTIAACDDQSWGSRANYGENVRRCDARQALTDMQPEVVICAWPPPLNKFEADVFSSSSVITYIVMGGYGKDHFGNWLDYTKQKIFSMSQRKSLTGHFYPSDLRGCLLIFNRINSF